MSFNRVPGNESVTSMAHAKIDHFALLNRLTYGPDAQSLQALSSLGWKKWLDAQLSPDNSDPEVEAAMEGFRYSMWLKENYQETVREFPLELYALDTQGLMATTKGENEPPDHVMRRPALETFLVTWMHILHSRWQLKELMVEFWHNHFNVSVEANEFIPLLLPIWDREVIRKHALGNFREFLEATAKSPCMLLYLDNAFSRSGPANENYARELFELHTLGAEHYYNHLYDDWKEVPGATTGLAEGYLDEDVYEAARAFTGWSFGDGNEHEIGLHFPRTGAFHYCDQFHDHYQKRILGVEFRSHQGPMADGRQVLDLVAAHPGTAKFVCRKICTWLVADDPPDTLVARAAATWMKHQKAPDQIARVLRTVLTSREFMSSLGVKLKRPNILVSSLLRGIGLNSRPDRTMNYWLRQMGYSYYSFSAPTGHPDRAEHWLNTDMMLKRWNIIPLLLYADPKSGARLEGNLSDQCPDSLASETDLIAFWSQRLLGRPASVTMQKDLQEAFTADSQGAAIPYLREHHPEGFEYKLRQMVALICMSPEFQKR